MPLTVLSVAYRFGPVGEAAVGGAEQVLGAIDRALTAAGHRSLVVACEGSAPAGELFATPLPVGALDQTDPAWYRDQVQAAIDRALRRHPVDLVHMHGLDFAGYRVPESVPVLVTLHMPVSWYSSGAWLKMRPGVHLQCVSESQRRSCPAELPVVAVVPNGVALPEQPPVRKENFALALGRICPEKNVHAALQAGSAAGLPVWIGGEVFPYTAHQQYFRSEVAPRLDGGHRFLGPLNVARKQDLLARARCLLHPTLAPETSSLVAMEALAAGTPVVAYPSGALPEIVEDGVTGFLVENAREMAEAIGRVGELRPEACRAAARERFSLDVMLCGYFDLYARLTGQPVLEPVYA